MHGAAASKDLVRWLLYWDKITHAGIGLDGASISGNHPDDVKYLESLGVFQTEIVDLRSLGDIYLPPPSKEGMKVFGLAGNQFPIVNAAARVKLCQTLLENTGNIWTLGQCGGETLILPEQQNSKELLDLKLVNCCLLYTSPSPRD